MNTQFRAVAFFLILALPAFQGSASDINNGNRLYQQHCAMCHGASGVSTMAFAPSFNRGEGLMQSDHSLLNHINTGRNACPAYLGILSEQQIFDVIAYIRTFF